MELIDNHGRPVNYLRLSVTDRCNLRCFYCMPEEGIKYLPQKELLSYEEMLRISSVLAQMGVNKVRITGGEPFVRRELISFLENLVAIEGIDKVSLTTNGLLTSAYIDRLKSLGVLDVNLSLDTLDRDRFKMITRRDELSKVMETLHNLLENGFRVKLNAVVMEGKNDEDILDLAAFTIKHKVDVRYIEEMPFNGEGGTDKLHWNHVRILGNIKEKFPELVSLPTPVSSTSVGYKIPGSEGQLGIIPAFSRTFCGSCNRLRLTAQGTLKTCLYDDGVMDIKQLLRSGVDDETLKSAFRAACNKRAKDGFEAEKNRENASPINESMSTIGG
ncbi:GTP 3',8-cyclase MoaA [Flammeovirgaceae bacterium SG7u.111]|nr:GTP 3',8-cyclase MoaA [Flammeovirgaceae bacterium SG7u.132]WPO33335.1 GTP 3',8-cyclase MoaA [Flammeovirgaceae bacterium SG7u.111]